MRPFKLSIAGKLVVAGLVIEALALSILLLVNAWIMDARLGEQVDLRLSETAKMLNATVALPLVQRDFGSLQDILTAVRDERGLDYLVVEDRGGKVVAASGAANPQTAGERVESRIPITIGAQVYGHLKFGLSTAFIETAKRSLLHAGLAVAAAESAVSAVILAFIGLRLMRRLKLVTRASEVIASGETEVRIDVPQGSDEIDRLCYSFNVMVDTLQERGAVVRRHYENLRCLSQIASLAYCQAGDVLTEALATAARHFGMDLGLIGRVENGTYTVLHHAAIAGPGIGNGTTLVLGETYCAIAYKTHDAVAIPDISRSSWADKPCHKAFGAESYIGAPFSVGGELFGTVSFCRRTPYPRPFDEGDIEFMHLLARWVATVIERERAENAVRQARDAAEEASRRSDLILSSAEEGIIELDGRGRVRFLNPAARRLLGWAGRDAAGLDLHATVHQNPVDGTEHPADRCTIRLTLTDGETRHGDDLFWLEDGTPLPVEYTVSALKGGAAVSGAVLMFHDVAERMAAQRALVEKSDELARSNAELEQFAYVASHDLREPLRMIGSYVSLLERRYADQLDDEAREFIFFARDGAERMNQMIQDLLEYSRVGRICSPLEPTPFALVVEAAQSSLTLAVEEAGASVTVPGDLPWVVGDRHELHRLMMNLLGNAIKYRDPERPCHVEVRWRAVNGERIEVSVADNGIGIAPEYFERIFQIFQRLHTRGSYSGNGMGLAICKKIVERHGGRIWVESEPGRGTTMLFTLPRATPAA